MCIITQTGGRKSLYPLSRATVIDPTPGCKTRYRESEAVRTAPMRRLSAPPRWYALTQIGIPDRGRICYRKMKPKCRSGSEKLMARPPHARRGVHPTCGLLGVCTPPGGTSMIPLGHQNFRQCVDNPDGTPNTAAPHSASRQTHLPRTPASASHCGPPTPPGGARRPTMSRSLALASPHLPVVRHTGGRLRAVQHP